MNKLFSLVVIAVIFASCSNKGNENAVNRDVQGAANEMILRKFYEQVMNGHNADSVGSFCSPDFVDHNPRAGHSGHGIDDFKASLKEFFTAYPDLTLMPNFIMKQGDTVMAYITMSGTNTGPSGPDIPATNKAVSIEAVNILIFKDGKASERWRFEDLKTVAEPANKPEPVDMRNANRPPEEQK